MAEPTEEELGQLLNSPTGFQSVTQRLGQEVAAKQTDPFQAAYDSIDQITEDSFAEIFNSPIGAENQFLATAELARASKAARQGVDIAKEPVNAFGGRELVSVFENQSGDFPVDSQTYANRVKLAGLMQRAMPEKFDEMVEKRNTLSPEDKDLFDRAFEQEFGSLVETTFLGQPTMRSGSPDRFDSPRQQKLWEDFAGEMKVVVPAGTEAENHEEYLRETKGDAWVDSNLNPTVKLNRQLADARQFVAGKFGEGVKAWYAQFTATESAIAGAATLLPREAIEGVTGQELPAPTVSSLIEVATGADRQKQSEFVGKLAEGLANETLRPENIFLIATSIGLYASGVGAPAGAAVQGNVVRTVATRVIANAMVGGFANSGAAWARDDSQGIKQLADDFVIGAFIEATIPEAMAAYAAIRGSKYTTAAMVEALEATSTKSRVVANITDNNMLVLDSAPRAATLADVAVTNINPHGTHIISDELDAAVNEAHVLAVDAQTNAGRMAQEAVELERRYAQQGELRDSIARARRGQAGPVQGAEDVVTDNMLFMARERAARAAATARDSSRTLTSIANTAERRVQQRAIDAATSGQSVNPSHMLKGDSAGIVSLTGDEVLFRGVDKKFVTGDNPLATPRRGVNVTPRKDVASEFADRNTTTGEAIDGEVLDVRAQKGMKVLEADGTTYDQLLAKLVNDEKYINAPIGQKQQFRDDFMEAAGFDGVLIYKQGLPVLRVFNSQKINVQLANQALDDMAKLNGRITAEIAEQTRTTTTLLNDLRDPFQSPYALRRIAHHIAASVSGRLPGSMQFVADAAINLRRSLDELTNPVVEKLALQADDLMRKEINNITFAGPAKWNKYLPLYKREMFLSRPDLFRGQSMELRRALQQAQELGTAKVNILQSQGYKVSALEGYYFPQFWDSDPKAVQQALRGKVSVAKDRIFGDVIEGLENGLVPRNMSIRDTLIAHDKMLNQGFGDASFRNIMEKRGLAVKGKPSVGAGHYGFDSPMFRGLVADKRTVQAVDSYFNVPPSVVTNVRGFAERVKNTSFGLFDLGVFGIQGASAIMKGGWLAVVGELTDNMMMRSLPGAERYADEAEMFWKVLYSRNGGVLGTVSSGYDMEAGTLIGALPISGLKKIDKVVTEQYMDRLSRLQFDTALTPVRLSIFKGHLFMQHLMRQDVSSPKVIRAAAEAANRATLTSRGAQTANRRSLESALLTSAQSARAEAANIASPLRPLADLITTGKINGPEAVAAYVGFAHLATMYYGIQWAVNESLGQPHEYFNPMDKDSWKKFGYIRVGDKQVALIKERSIIKAMEQSFEGLMQHDPEYVAEVWSKVFIGKLSPAVGAVASLGTGYGYDTQGFFQTGELDTRSKLLNFIPFPLSIEKAFLQPEFRSDPVAMSLEFFGYNNYDLSVVDRRDEFVRVHNPYAPDDPRHADVQAHGFGGMERAEAQIFRQENPQFFNGKNNLDPAEKAVFDTADDIRANLLELEDEVRSDPFKRREYREKRQDLVAQLGQLFTGKKSADVTMQDKALSIYYDTINAFRSAKPGETFYGDDFGVAEEAARTAIEAQFGEGGIAALDRAIVVGSTGLETEYRTARRTIADSGYYDIADAVVAAKSGGVWSNYREFRDSLNELAVEKGLVPEQMPSFRDMDALISDAKEKFRERNPQIDAQLVIWDGSTPRSTDAQELASQTLGRDVALAVEVANRIKKQDKKQSVPDADFADIISRFR